MKHIILILIVMIAMFTFWRSMGSTLPAGEHTQETAVQTEIITANTAELPQTAQN